jgi:uncharacterized protein
MEATRAHGVWSPLLEAGLTKEAIREEARRRGLPNWDKPSGACLSSRFPYGTTITREGLEQVAAVEKALRGLGFRTIRVRHHGTIARIELGEAEVARAVGADVRAAIVAIAKASGFLYVALDLEGYRTGSLNAVLASVAADRPGGGE